MAKTKEQKKEIVKQLEERISQMKSLVFSSYYGLKVNEIQELRELLKEKGGDYLVTKKTLLNLALKNKGFKAIDSGLVKGEFGLAFGFEDELAPVKVLFNFQKEHKDFQINAGILEKNFISKEEVLVLAQLPSKNELLAKLVGSIRSPLSGLVGSLRGNLRNLVGVLESIREAKA